MHQLTGVDLTPMQVLGIARRLEKAALSREARDRVRASAKAFEELRAGGTDLAGMTPNVGAHASRDRQETAAMARSLLRSHAAGVGPAMPVDEVRAMLLVRANNLAGGMSGIRLRVLDLWLSLLNRNIIPLIPRGGSIAGSDLAPLAHAALVLAGEGRVVAHDGEMDALGALQRVGLLPVSPEPRDASSLINGLAHTAGLAALVVADAERLLWVATESAAMSIAAGGGTGAAFESRVVGAKQHPGSVGVARRLERLLEGATQPATSRPEPATFRAAHHVLGAFSDVTRFADQLVTVELNATVDNPMIAGDGWSTDSAGNTDSTHLSLAMGQLISGLAAVASCCERRVARLLDPATNGGLPPFLVHPRAPSGSSGLTHAHRAAASLLGELRTLGAPFAALGTPTCASIDDYTALGPLAASRASRALELTTTLVAIELLCAAQALDLRGTIPTALRHPHALFRERVRVMVSDRVIADDIAEARRFVVDPDTEVAPD